MTRLTDLFSTASVTGAQFILLSASPVQPLIDRPTPTHSYCNRQACRILREDGLEREAAVVEANLSHLQQGSDWADSGFRNSSHYYDPDTRRGLWRYPDAAQTCTKYFHKALGLIGKRPDRAFFFLGAATHIVQDLCVPHHAAGLLWNGHREFESRAADVRHLHDCHDGGLYWVSDRPGGWVARNAEQAKPWLSAVTEEAARGDIEEAIAVLLRQAQQSTSGFWRFFLESAEVRI